MQSVEHRQQEVLVELDVSWKHPRDAAAQQIVDAIQERTIRVVRALLRPEFGELGHCRGGAEPTPGVPGGVVAAPSSRRHPDGSFLIHATRSVPPATVIGSPSNSGTFVQ